MELPAILTLIIQIIVLLCVCAAIAYIAVELSKYKTETESNLTAIKDNVTSEAQDRVSNLKYVVDQVNKVHTDIYKDHNNIKSAFGELSDGTPKMKKGAEVNGMLRVNKDKNEKYPAILTKGVHANSVYSTYAVAAGKDGNVAAFMDSNGQMHASVVSVGEQLRITGGTSEWNRELWGTYFPAADGKNYLRGDTEIRGNTSNIGDLDIGRNATVHKTLYIGNTSFEKISPSGTDPSSLRVTLNGDNAEALEVWGKNTPASVVSKKHSFDIAGNAVHTGNVSANGLVIGNMAIRLNGDKVAVCTTTTPSTCKNISLDA